MFRYSKALYQNRRWEVSGYISRFAPSNPPLDALLETLYAFKEDVILS